MCQNNWLCNRGGAGVQLFVRELSMGSEVTATNGLLVSSQWSFRVRCGHGWMAAFSLRALQVLPPFDWLVSWGTGDRLRALSRRDPEPSPRPPTGGAQASKQQRASPHPRLRVLKAVPVVSLGSVHGGLSNGSMWTLALRYASTSFRLAVQISKPGPA